MLLELLNYMVGTVSAIGVVLLIYVVIQIYSSNNPYRQDDSSSK